jgi:hypothetical protein
MEYDTTGKPEQYVIFESNQFRFFLSLFKVQVSGGMTYQAPKGLTSRVRKLFSDRCLNKMQNLGSRHSRSRRKCVPSEHT